MASERGELGTVYTFTQARRGCWYGRGAAHKARAADSAQGAGGGRAVSVPRVPGMAARQPQCGAGGRRGSGRLDRRVPARARAQPLAQQPAGDSTRALRRAAALQKAKGKPLLRVPLVAGALVLEFESEADRDQVVDVLTPLAKQAAGPARAGAAERGAELSGPLAAVKKQLLEEDRRGALSVWSALPRAGR